MSLRISRQEWDWVGAVLIVILLLSSLPYLVGYSNQTPEKVFSGAVFDRMDVSVHLATMHLGARGEWAYRLRMTGEEQPGTYMKLAYIALGHLARWTGLSLPAAYHLGRLVAGLLAGVTVYLFAAHLFSEIIWRRMAFLLAFLGSGLGWLQLMIGALPQLDISPVDFWLVDAYLFFGLTIFPHFALVTALLAGMVASYLSFLRHPAVWKLAVAALCGVLIQPVQPYAPLLGDLAIAGAWAGFTLQRRKISWASLLPLLVIGLAQVPPLIYNLLVVTNNPIWQGFSSQNITASPPFSYYLWGFGLLWVAALPGVGSFIAWVLIRGARDDSPESAWDFSVSPVAFCAALAWCAGALILSYSPTVLQRRFMMSYSLPLAFLAVCGLKWVFSCLPFTFQKPSGFKISPRFISPLALLFVLLASLSSFYLAAGYCLVMASRPAEYFDSAELVQAVDWLSDQAGPDDVVFSSEKTGQLIAARAGLPVYLGHPIETLNYPEKTRLVSGFFQAEVGVEALRDGGVRWVIFGPYEQALAGESNDLVGLPLSQEPGMVEMYSRPSVSIYRVEP